MSIIGISGKKQHGKDTIADYLVHNYMYRKMSFADPLKKVCSVIFGFTKEQMSDSKLKETPDARWKVSPRQALQFVGTDLFRNHFGALCPAVSEHIWVEAMRSRIDKRELTVIPDIRFKDELDLIHELGGIVVNVVRDSVESTDKHVSEKAVEGYDISIKNNGTIQSLYQEVDKVLLGISGSEQKNK